MESEVCKHSIYHILHKPNIWYINSYCNRKTFVQRPKRTQRLIPLTPEIRKAMMDFDAAKSSTSLEKQIYNTISISSIVRAEIQNILQQLSLSDQFVRKNEINNLIEKCIRKKETIIQENDCESNNTLSLSGSGKNKQEKEVMVEEMMKDQDRNKVRVENFQILKQLITTLEERLSLVHQTISKIKINAETLKKVIRLLMKAELSQKTEKQMDDKAMKSGSEEGVKTYKKNVANEYDDIYYTRREYALNLLNYKKSLETMALNEKPCLNPYVKPVIAKMSEISENLKQKPIFLTPNDV